VNCTTTTTNILLTVTCTFYFSKKKNLLLLLNTRILKACVEGHKLFPPHTVTLHSRIITKLQNAKYVLIAANINILVFWDINWKKKIPTFPRNVLSESSRQKMYHPAAGLGSNVKRFLCTIKDEIKFDWNLNWQILAVYQIIMLSIHNLPLI